MTESNEGAVCIRPVSSKGGVVRWEEVPVSELKPVYGDFAVNVENGTTWMYDGEKWVRIDRES